MLAQNNQPLISVIMPVYNVENFVEEAVLSICNQTYKNLEIIIIDDSSTDNTYNIIKKISYFDPRIILLKNDINLKIVKTLNKGLDIAKGEYIARMDGDDISYPKKLEKQLSFLIKNPEIDLVGCQVDTLNERGNKIGQIKLPLSNDFSQRIIRYSSPVLHIWLAKKKIYDLLKGYREILGAEDYDFLLRLVTSNIKFSNLRDVEYGVRLRAGNTTSTIGFMQKIMANYSINLFNERLKYGYDSFSTKDAIDYNIRYKKYKNNYDMSNLFLHKAILARSHKNYLLIIFYITLAAFKSKFQFKYLLNRTIAKIIMRYE